MSDSDLEQSIATGHSGLVDSTTERAVPVAAGSDLVDRSDGDEVPGAPIKRRRRPDLGLLIPCLVIACGLVGIIWGVSSAITGTDGIDRPDAIEDLSPVENAQQVVEQQQIVVDLQFGFEAALVIDGIELPTTNIGQVSVDPGDAGRQIDVPPTAVFDPGNARIEFRPSDDALITSFAEGRHQVQVIYWRIEDGRADGARSYRWAFDVV